MIARCCSFAWMVVLVSALCNVPARPVFAAKIDPRWLPFISIEEVGAASAGASLKLTGRIGYDEEHTHKLASPLTGRVTQVLVAPGQKVVANQPLLELMAPEAAQLKGEVLRAQQDVAQSERAAKRVVALLHDGAISEREAALTHAELAKAQAELDRAQAHLASFGLSLDRGGARAVLVARHAGTVTERKVVVGQEVRQDAPDVLIVVADLNRVWVWADVFEQDLGQVSVQAKAKVTVPAYPQRQFLGEVAQVGEVVDAQTRTVKVRCTLDNACGLLKPDMFANVWIAQPAQGVWVPAQAVVYSDEKPTLWVVGAGDALELRPVTLGRSHAGKQQVLSGLSAKERIVADGALFVSQAIAN